MKKSWCCLVVMLVLFSGCGVLFARYDRYMEEWRLQDEDTVYIVYGPPMRTQELKDGRKIVAYDFTRSGSESGDYCEVKFTLQGGTVESATYRGNLGGVERFVRRPPADKRQAPPWELGDPED